MLIYLSLIDTEDGKCKFEEMYNSYKKTMFYVANDILKDNLQAEDVVHTSFIKIINNLDKIEEVHCNKTKGFIVTITRNTAIDFYRKNKREKEKIEKIKESQKISENIEVDTIDDIQRAILKLPHKYKSVFSLKYYQGLDYEEISELLDIKESSVRSRISRGKDKLKKILEEMKVVNFE